jgi:hypothetical protein
LRKAESARPDSRGDCQASKEGSEPDHSEGSEFCPCAHGVC